MDRKVLLLNSNYEPLSIIEDRRAIRLFFKEKVEIISTWDDVFLRYYDNCINFPAILRMKYFIKKSFTKLIFSRASVLKRDKYSCSYCGLKLNSETATMDHIVPKFLGGQSVFTNCVASCYPCNSKKGNKLLTETDMILLNQPTVPIAYLNYFPDDQWHKDWETYLK